MHAAAKFSRVMLGALGLVCAASGGMRLHAQNVRSRPANRSSLRTTPHQADVTGASHTRASSPVQAERNRLPDVLPSATRLPEADLMWLRALTDCAPRQDRSSLSYPFRGRAPPLAGATPVVVFRLAAQLS